MKLSKQMRGGLFVTLMLTAVSLSTGCGGGAQAGGAKSAQASASPMDQLQAIPTDIQHDVTAMTQPVDDTQGVIDDLTSLPKRHGISAGDMTKMCKAAFDNGEVKVETSGEISAEARAELEATLKRLTGIVKGLKETPSRVAAMTQRLGKSLVQVPVLVGQVTTKATLDAASPFGGAEKRAKASADLQAVGKVKDDVTRSISEAQQKISALPAEATGALGKLGASIASFDGGSPATGAKTAAH